LIFLGAGASKRFGIKTLQDMTDDLIKILKEKKHEQMIVEIIDGLKRFQMIPDFEAIYTIIDGLIDPQNAIKYYGPFTAYMCKNLLKDTLPSREDLLDLLKVTREYIYEECKLKPEFHANIKSIFNRLFDVLEMGVDRRFPINPSISSIQNVNIGYTIATTNYDLIAESYLWNKGEEFADGFRGNNPFERKLDFTTFSEKRERWLVKLHGSIWQYRYQDKIFKTNQDPEKLKGIFPVNIDEKMMIYPTGEKPILKDPYYSFYRVFRMQEWSRLIVIGYSFRDDPVNIAINQNMDRDENSTLIIVDPKAEEIIKNFSPDLQRYLSRIIRIPNEFGNEIIFDKLEVAIKASNYEEYREKLRKEKNLSPLD